MVEMLANASTEAKQSTGTKVFVKGKALHHKHGKR